MPTIDVPAAAFEMDVEDPVSGEVHTFTGATEAEAVAAAERFFGVNDAEENEQ